MFNKTKWKKGVPLKNFTSFRIGGKAKFFIQVFSENDLRENILEARRKRLPVLILGGGTNILVSDKGFPGLVIKIAFSEVHWSDNQVIAGSGVPLPFLVEEAKKRSLSGLEWGAGIPGTLGGATRGNAGTKGEYLGQHLKEAQALDKEQLASKIYSANEGEFGYRQSFFKEHPDIIITKVVLNLESSNPEKIEQKMNLNLQARKNQPLDFPSAGSIFKNPSLAPAGKLIEEVGLKGERFGKAQISFRHANFIINLGGAKSSQVLALIREAEKRVEDKFNVSLEREIVVLDERS